MVRGTPSLLAGMTPAQLQTAYGAAQTALVALNTGSKGETLAYAQGDGQKSITFTRANIAQLSFFITELQRALGIRGRRRAITFRF